MNLRRLAGREGRALIALLVPLLGAPACSSFGRKFNQALPEFLRSEPGKDELDRYRERVRVLKRSPEDVAAAHRDFLEAKNFVETGDFENGNTALEAYLERWPDTADDKEARFLLIQARLGDEEWFDAQEAIRGFIANYPITDFNDQVEEIMWKLGSEYLEGEHDVFIFSKEGDGLRLLRDMVLHFPNGAHADDAHWKLGNYYYDDGDWIEAQAAFTAIIEEHPNSPWAARAQYDRGLCRLAQVKGAEYDAEIARKARGDFLVYLERYPEGDRREQAVNHVARLDELLGEMPLSIGDWYLGQDYPWAARFYYQKVLRMHPNTQAAAIARERLAGLPTDVLPPEPLSERSRDDDLSVPQPVFDPSATKGIDK